MKRTIIIMFLSLLYMKMSAQNIVKGVVVDSDSEQPLEKVILTIKGESSVKNYSRKDGTFIIKNLNNGRAVLSILFKNYESQNFELNLTGTTITLGTIFLYKKRGFNNDLSTITLTDDELNEESNSADNITGLLQSSRDLYLRSAAFEFSSSFFRVRGLDSENSKVLINGIEMNKFLSGRPLWSNWGGLNNVTRNQEFSPGLSPSVYTFGGVLGTTNINIRASKTRAGNSISYASSNRSYEHRVLVTHASGILKNDWSYVLSASRRAGKEGYNDGTFYDANSLLISIEKKLTSKNSLNASIIYTPNKRGKSSANTQEVTDLKGIRYNSYWGFQNGRIRNSREKSVVEPIFMINHYWKLNQSTSINSNMSYQFGEISNSRIDYNGSKIDGIINGIPTIVSLGGSNPDPSYYQNLPSYDIKNGGKDTYKIQEAFINNGQLSWENLYVSNSNNFNNDFATYVLYDDINKNEQLTINTIIEAQIFDNIQLNAKFAYKNFQSNNYAKVRDLFGASKYLDIDNFASANDLKQNDINNPNREVQEGEKFKYNYLLTAEKFNSFLQAQFNYNSIDFYTALNVSQTSYQRIGRYRNGKFANLNDSFGNSLKRTFINYGVKAGATYKITGRHLLNINTGYLSKAPLLKNTFSNPRIQNNIVPNLKAEHLLLSDISYIYRGQLLQAKLTGYFSKISDATEVAFYYADGLGGSGSEYTAFVQEVISGLDKKHVGLEFGIEAQVTPTIKLKTAGNLGEYIYTNNPLLSLSSEAPNFQFESRKTNLKNYKIAAGPQQAYSLGFEYRDPDYWWFGATINFFNNIYIDVAPITRTSNFSNDNGIPFNDFDPDLAKELLQQEEFKSYNIINLVGGKSWKINDYYIGLFASISNLQNTLFKTGGFEQSRNANYRELRDDKALNKPLFGSKYWHGRGTSYFININFRF